MTYEDVVPHSPQKKTERMSINKSDPGASPLELRGNKRTLILTQDQVKMLIEESPYNIYQNERHDLFEVVCKYEESYFQIVPVIPDMEARP